MLNNAWALTTLLCLQKTLNIPFVQIIDRTSVRPFSEFFYKSDLFFFTIDNLYEYSSILDSPYFSLFMRPPLLNLLNKCRNDVLPTTLRSLYSAALLKGKKTPHPQASLGIRFSSRCAVPVKSVRMTALLILCEVWLPFGSLILRRWDFGYGTNAVQIFFFSLSPCWPLCYASIALFSFTMLYSGEVPQKGSLLGKRLKFIFYFSIF